MSTIKRHLYQPVTSRLARLLATTSLSATHILFIGFLIAILAAWSASSTHYAGLFLAAILAYLSGSLHIASEEIARLKETLSDNFGVLSRRLGVYGELFLIAGLCAHAVVTNPRIICLVITILAAGGIFLLERVSQEPSHELLKNVCFIRNSETRVLIIAITALFNIPLVGLLIIAVCANALVIAPLVGLKSD